MGVKRGKLMPPRLPLAVAQELPDAEAVVRFEHALQALAEGKTEVQARREAGIPDARTLAYYVGRSPQLMAALTAAREGFRELNQFRAQALIAQRFDSQPEDISNRDLTDIIRATKPFDNATAVKIEVAWDK